MKPETAEAGAMTAEGISRRRALGLLAAGAASAVAGCSSSGSSPSTPDRRTASSPSRHSSKPTHDVTGREVRALRRKIAGDVLLPGDAQYDQARLLFNRRFDGVRPALVARVTSGDVSHCLDFAKRLRVPVALRSGGHSYLGASTSRGLVIDLRGISDVKVGAGGTASVGAGAALVDVYNVLAGRGVSVPAGSCPTVGMSGLALGGGIGVVARRYGLTCDRLRSAQVVTATGDVVTADETTHPDLFWALRGGGGSFGAVTSMTFETHPADPLSHAYVAWPWEAAADVVAAWQRWAPATPASLWSAAHVLATDKTGPPQISVVAVMVGSTASLTQQLGELTQAVATAPTSNVVSSESYAATMMLEAGCSQLSVQQCHVAAETPGGTLPRDAFVAGSDFFAHPIPRAGIDALVSAVEHRQRDPRLGAGGAAFDALGGAVDNVKRDATAWSHRGALFDAQYTASWGAARTNRPQHRNQRSLAAIRSTVQRYARGDAYQNYADASLPEPLLAYYGDNLARLIAVRRTYDPTGVFTQPQGVPLR
jgi:FAD/FMN-containing dehydrogenase